MGLMTFPEHTKCYIDIEHNKTSLIISIVKRNTNSEFVKHGKIALRTYNPGVLVS